MPQCQLPVFCCFWFQKQKNEYSRNWTGQKPNFIFFLERYEKSKKRWSRAPGWPHPRVVWPHPRRATRRCGPPGPPPTLPPSPIRIPLLRNPKGSTKSHEKFRSAATIKGEIRGIEVSVLAPSWD